ncbi:MAG: hypothetical protein J7L11_03790 [Thermoprotei archaeon]|nr:hypothetical protein [Thermoprotei archaeon]
MESLSKSVRKLPALAGGWIAVKLKYTFTVFKHGMLPMTRRSSIRPENGEGIARSLTRGVGWGCREPALNSRMKPSAVKAGGTGEAPSLRAG